MKRGSGLIKNKEWLLISRNKSATNQIQIVYPPPKKSEKEVSNSCPCPTRKYIYETISNY